MEENESDLLKKAEIEEKNYNWAEAAKIYERAAKSFLDINKLEKAAGIYRKLGEAYYWAALAAETAEEYTESYKSSVKVYKKGGDLFNQIGRKSEELECEAESNNSNGFLGGSIMEVKEAFSKSYNLFIKSSELYSIENNKEGLARTLASAALASTWLISYCSDPKEIKNVYEEGIKVTERAWMLSKEIGNTQLLAISLVSEAALWAALNNIVNFKKNEIFRGYFIRLSLRREDCLKIIERTNDYRILSLIYYLLGQVYCSTGFQLIEDESEQRESIDKGLKYLEQALIFSRKSNIKTLIIQTIYWLDWWSLFGGKFEYVQRRILEDIKEIVELGRIFENSNNTVRSFAFLLPAVYYNAVSHMKIFTTSQRKSYAEKGIEYAKRSLEGLPPVPNSSWAYQMLTWSYSALIILTAENDEMNKYIQEMIYYAEKANEIGEKYEGGFPKAAGYSSLYKAYKTLADITNIEKERIKMLSAAADVQKRYIPHSVESRTGTIAAQMRLGLLYEELGILSIESNSLMQAKELFNDLIKETLERGYYSYAAATYEYIAQIEDRLGNYTASAENYKKAQEMHKESLKKIEYKLLRKRVNEKIDYARAWHLIEQAKTYHKRENHLKAEESYEQASEILKTVRRYQYEASYYIAWALLEEAEQFSKQERQDDAIEQYESTKISFENAIKLLEKASKQSKEKSENERIGKLEKVARIRINYCTARIDLEKARILGKQGQHIAAAEKFALAASQFIHVCSVFKIERERRELEAIYYLCRAWECMELAENYEEPDRFSDAADLFTKASNLFTETKLKSLASGNSAFCLALEYGYKFDETIETQVKAQFYQQVKAMLRKAESSYDKGGFENGADWALATSTYFDATWHIIRADETLELNEREKLLRIGSKYLKSAAELFGKAGYKDKEMEIRKRLNRLEKEEKILVSALNTIQEPSLSRSTIGIVAPSCPIEIGHSTRLSEIREISEEERRVTSERGTKKKYQIIHMDLIEKYPKVQKRECRVAIAQIGVSKTGDILSEFYDMKASGLLGLREDKIEMVKSNVKSMIENANENGVNILFFPEMTVDLNYSEFLEEISNLARLYEMYIIPGSYHDQETNRNLSLVISPEGILWEQPKHIPALIHFGKKKLKEAIEVGTIPRKTIVCNTEYGRIAIAICRDFLDMDLRVELKNFEPAVDIILNPAFTPVTADFKAAHFDARRSIYAYCFFANVGEFGDSLIYTPEKERKERTIPPKEEGLIYKDLDLFKLRSEREKWEKEQKKERLFIQSTR